MEDIEHYDIPVYNFPYDVEEDDEDTIEDNSELRVNTIDSVADHLYMIYYRPLCPLRLSVLKMRLRWTDNWFAQGFTRGVLPRSTIQSTLILADSAVLCSSL